VKTLNNKKHFPRNQLIKFMNALNQEKRYFLLTVDEILESEVLIYEERHGRIAGIAGIRFLPGIIGKFFKLPLSYIVVLQEFQGQSIGGKLFAEKYRIAEEKYNYLVNTISKDNQKMLKLNNKLDYKYLGEAKDRYYFLRPFNFRGLSMYYLLKIGFWFLMPFRLLCSKFSSSP